MKFKILLTITFALLSTFTHAGMITNTNNDSFIDETTEFEWMDFGVNNIYSYNEVVALIPTTYEGWRLATESEVLTLWRNAFGGTTYMYSEFPTGDLYSGYSTQYINGISDYDIIYAAMGYNVVGEMDSYGWFADTTGGLSYAMIQNHSTGSDYAGVHGRDQAHEQYRDYTGMYSLYYSTMLVKEINIAVPEPSTLAIFALGILGLASRRFKKKLKSLHLQI